MTSDISMAIKSNGVLKDKNNLDIMRFTRGGLQKCSYCDDEHRFTIKCDILSSASSVELTELIEHLKQSIRVSSSRHTIALCGDVVWCTKKPLMEATRFATKMFKNFTYEAIVSNDTPYDIDSFFNDYERACEDEQLTPNMDEVHNMLIATCKRPTITVYDRYGQREEVYEEEEDF